MQSILLPAASLQIWIEKRARGAPAFRAARVLQTRRAAIDRHRLPLPAESTAANPPHAAAAIDRWDRRTDGRTDGRQLHRLCSAYCASSANKCDLYEICRHITTRSSTRSLRSSSAPLLHVPFRRSFNTAAPSVWNWNSLPVSVQNCDTLTLFKSRLKAHLFSSVYAS